MIQKGAKQLVLQKVPGVYRVWGVKGLGQGRGAQGEVIDQRQQRGSLLDGQLWRRAECHDHGVWSCTGWAGPLGEEPMRRRDLKESWATV